MNMPKLFRHVACTGSPDLVAASCDNGDGIVTPVDQADGRITITNNEAVMAGRMIYPGTPVPIDDPLPGLSQSMRPQAPRPPQKEELEMTLESEVRPPTIDGATVQATSVAIQGTDKVMVSYNMRGAPRLGAIDWITKLTKKPQISASATFNDTDISALSMDGNYVYAAASTEPVEFPFPAVLERLRLKRNKFILDDNLRVPLTSYVATSTLVTDKVVYATSGNTAAMCSPSTRKTSITSGRVLPARRPLGGMGRGGRPDRRGPGNTRTHLGLRRRRVLRWILNLLNTFPFPGADVPESKSTVEISGGKAFIAAGPEGVQIVCLDNGEVIGSVPRPDPASWAWIQRWW